MTAALRDLLPMDAGAAHILVVDDDARIRTLLARYLGREGFRVSVASDARDARTRLGSLAFDLAVVDVMMPGESGLGLVSWLRRQANLAATPVLMLTARSDAADRIGGLEAGADDYLGKPFEPRELLLRIRAILRRAPAIDLAAAEAVRFGPFAFHLKRGELRREGQPVRLTERERVMLRTLAAAGGETVLRSHLTAPAGATERAVDVQVARLRRKIEPDPLAPVHLLTTRGVGYQLVCDTIFGDKPSGAA